MSSNRSDQLMYHYVDSEDKSESSSIRAIRQEMGKLNEEGELHYTKSEIGIFEKCIEIIKNGNKS